MKSHNAPSTEWMDARVEAYIDGDLPREERELFEQTLDADDAWAREVQCAQRIQDELHALPVHACPPQVTQAVMERTRGTAPSTWAAWWERAKRELDIEFHLGWRPALISTALIMLVALSVYVSGPPDAANTLPQTYSAAEIQRAEAQAEWTLAFIARIGQRTESKLRQDVIEPRLEQPVRRALDPIRTSDPLKEESESPDRQP